MPTRLAAAPAFAAPAFDANAFDATPRERAPAPAAIVPSAVAAAPSSRSLPKVTPFELPMAQLAQIAEGSGLHWVNSDAERIAHAKAAIAAEPQPVHVPRQRPPAVVLDDEPLVLVETRRDLTHVVLPFEQAAPRDNAAV